MQLVVLNLTEQDCVVLDSKDWSGRDELSCYGLHCSALQLTVLESTAVELYVPGLYWIEMYLAGME